jgi:hypothetical protein
VTASSLRSTLSTNRGGYTKVRTHGYNLTPFLKFGLRGVALQSGRLAEMIKNEVSKADIPQLDA